MSHKLSIRGNFLLVSLFDPTRLQVFPVRNVQGVKATADKPHVSQGLTYLMFNLCYQGL